MTRSRASTWPGGEAQAAAIADDIAYNAHDIDDGLRHGLFDLDDLRGVEFLAGLIAEIEARHPGLEKSRVVAELGRRVITRFVEDVIGESLYRLREAAPAGIDDIRAAGRPMIAFSQAMEEADRAIKAFLFPRMYRAPSVVKMREQATRVVSEIFPKFMDDPALMPPEWTRAAEAKGADVAGRARVVCDYIAGMTDRYAAAQHRLIFDGSADLR
jgi:dGTPase